MPDDARRTDDDTSLTGEPVVPGPVEYFHRVDQAPTGKFAGTNKSSDETTAVRRQSPAMPGGSPVIPGYDIVGELGRGGMGVVYKAWHVKSKQFVALKMIVPGSETKESLLRRFKTEAEAVTRLSHPNIVKVYEVGECNGWPYFSLEFCGGGSLAKKLSGTPLLPTAAAELTQKLAHAIAAAHAKQIVHRDLKPANILLTPDNVPKIGDFGLAKRLDAMKSGSESGGKSKEDFTRANVVMGSPSYMPPEQASGQARTVGPSADIYALGAIFYECLTGRPPFKGATTLDTLDQVRHQVPVPPRMFEAKIPIALETICMKCLSKEPSERYASAADLTDDLRRYLRGEPIKALRPSLFQSAMQWIKRKPKATALIAVVALGVVACTSYFIIELDRSRREAVRQLEELRKVRNK